MIYIDGMSGIQVSGGNVVLFADNLLLHQLITCFDDFEMTLQLVIIPQAVTVSEQMQVIAPSQEDFQLFHLYTLPCELDCA